MWLAGLGGGLLSLPFVWWFKVPARSRNTAPSTTGGPATYVDQDGWMLTPDDVAALAARRPAP